MAGVRMGSEGGAAGRKLAAWPIERQHGYAYMHVGWADQARQYHPNGVLHMTEYGQVMQS